MHKRAAYVIFAMIACLAASPAFAKKYYKWADADGVTHYTVAKPAEGIPSEIVDDKNGAYTESVQQPAAATTPTDKAAADAAAPAASTPAVEERKKQQDAECQKVRDQLNTLQTSARVRTVEKDGTQRVMTAEEHQAAIDRATAYLKDCK